MDFAVWGTDSGQILGRICPESAQKTSGGDLTATYESVRGVLLSMGGYGGMGSAAAGRPEIHGFRVSRGQDFVESGFWKSMSLYFTLT